jgi:hypothetical protein
MSVDPIRDAREAVLRGNRGSAGCERGGTGDAASDRACNELCRGLPRRAAKAGLTPVGARVLLMIAAPNGRDQAVIPRHGMRHTEGFRRL